MRTVAACLAVILISTPAGAQQMRMYHSGERNTPTKTRIVDGDTLWLKGVNIRLEGFDTPESQTNICGGAREKALAARASARLLDLLNGNSWTVELGGIDGTGARRLGTIRIGGADVGDILIAEGLARKWPNGREFWCN